MISRARTIAEKLEDSGQSEAKDLTAIRKQTFTPTKKRKVRTPARDKDVGAISGAGVRSRLDRPARKSARRADGGFAEPPPGADRSKYREPSAD